MRGILAAVILLCGNFPTLAANDIVRSDVGFFVQTSGGKPAMCGTEFTIVFKDDLNQKGNLSVVTGSITTMGLQDKLGSFLKISGGDQTKPGELRPYRPFSVSLSSPTAGNINRYSETNCEGPFAYCATYDFNSTALIWAATQSADDLRIRFNRAEGYLDIELPILTKKGMIDHPADFTEFMKCENALLSEARRALSTKQ